MVGTETTTISGNVVGENLVRQKKEANIKVLDDGSVGLLVCSVPPQKTVKKLLVLQRVKQNNPQRCLMMEHPSPSDLNNDNSLDLLESAPFSNTSSASVLNENFFFLMQEEETKKLKGVIRVVARLGVRVMTAGGVAYIKKNIITFGWYDGSYHPFATHQMDTPLQNDLTTTSYKTFQSFTEKVDAAHLANSIFYVNVNVHGFVNASTTRGIAAISLSRGSSDSYLETPFKI